MSRGLRRPLVRIACAFVFAAALVSTATLARADEQRVARLGFALYAMPTSLGLHDVNQSVDQLNVVTSTDPFNLAPIGKITWGAVFGGEAKYFVNRNWALVAGIGRISRQSILDLQPAATSSIVVKAKVRTVPRYLGVDRYFAPHTSGDFTLRPFVGAGYMDLVETKTVFGGLFTSPEENVGSLSFALGEGNGFYAESGIHMMFPSRYSVLLNAHYRNARVKRLYDESTGVLLLNQDGEPYSVDVSGFGLRIALQFNIAGKPAD
jgi:outer membrane protein W